MTPWLVTGLVAGALAGAEPPLQTLAWLIGTWTFADRSTPAAGFDMAEIGRRRCELAIDNQYIRCESVGTAGSKRRTYVFYFSYDAVDRRFEMVALHGNWPRTIFYTGRSRDAGRALELLSEPYLDGGKLKRSWGVIRYDGQRSYVWESGTFPDGSADRGPVRFRDQATRSVDTR